ncbi:hypothetical protein BDB00DRAFT_447504 [Zychaea mexicana]|uniref:uncharacterized protein n=1 Tax=Zychaea mexicana TaxID=64656 RepID=UPI0022FEB135|nr:uncharacterized protein BDB00DRAFT_447504 [Zychaea mexicana]KAI9498412.1 hypothetical protein BDB00DRAFT_447504 [Zychaea mexicana]
MAPMEQRLFAALTAAGFDESTVRNMRQSSDVGNALGTLWHMLMDNMSKNEPMVSGVAVPANNRKKPSEGPAYRVVEKGTQTDDMPPTPSPTSTPQKQQQHQQLQPPPSPVRPTVSEPLRPAAPPAIPITSIEGHPKVSVSSAQSRSTASSTSEKSGWFTSVKSWFGTTKQQQQQQQQFEEQQRLHAASAALRAREIQESSPAYQLGANQKYRRHVLQLPNSTTAANQQQADPFSYSSTFAPSNMPQYPALARPQAAHNKPSLDSYYKAGNAFGPARPPTVLTCPKSAAVANTLSAVKTPPPTTAATQNTAMEVDVCEKRYAQYRSANRPGTETVQRQQDKPQEPVVTIAVSPAPQRPLGIVAPKSPVPTTTVSTPVTPIRTTSPPGLSSSPLSSQASSLVEEEEDDDEEASSPASSISTVENLEEDNNKKNNNGSSSTNNVNNHKLNVPPPSPTSTRSWPLVS